MNTPGIILLDKEAGLSSAAALAKVKRELNLQRAGHCGTLDPFATGLLIILCNRATRLADYIQVGRKVYSGSIRLGVRTDSDDITGTVLEERPVRVTGAQLKLAAESFCGVIDQKPPSISALKVNGERAYRLARRGETPQLASRQVEISELEFELYDERTVNFRLACSKGTYVRSLARDLGEFLGCGACVAQLRREESAPFSVAAARKISELSEVHILDWTSAFPNFARVDLSESDVKGLASGNEQTLLSLVPRLSQIIKANSISSLAEDVPSLVIGQECASGRAAALLVNDGRWRVGCVFPV